MTEHIPVTKYEPTVRRPVVDTSYSVQNVSLIVALDCTANFKCHCSRGANLKSGRVELKGLIVTVVAAVGQTINTAAYLSCHQLAMLAATAP